eukprot:TRINITY_DN93_c0_g2_i1.p1 TRINITY_DN93_c0_g2~~TRINITY_DN93_c0_g2_i1.p1  ORF type:complete len:278 (+),score=73.78 TRINITY_DN93_c0_g2_i1:790-1623(+)
MRFAKPGMMEYDLEAKFRYEIYHRYGCRNVGYTCICCAGESGAILHYGHAGAPNSKVIKPGDMCLLDMGGEYHHYTADITRSWPVDGKFTETQREIYTTVYEAQEAVMRSMRPGVSWPEMHRLADRVICENLKKFGYLNGDVDEMMKEFVGSLFMPHGLGHLLGLTTHDVGGYLDGIQRSTEPGLKSLRCGRTLLEGMVITVEPGVYFNRSVLEPAFSRPNQAQFMNVEKIKKMFAFGGVRIEDDVLVTATGIENLSAGVPRSIDEIEAWIAGGRGE